jgi:pilus assembly protein Flp/PilA
MQHVIRSVRSVLGDERAATMPEYALMVALIAVVCVAAVTLVGGNANNIFNQIAAAIAAG